MCGIVGAIAQRNVTPILMEGLRRLEYRGYDSAGIAVVQESDSSLNTDQLSVSKSLGKVAELESQLDENIFLGHTGLAHTRWATHGAPSQLNAHPHCSGDMRITRSCETN